MDKEYFASINTVSRELGIPAHTLRYWEKQFPTVVRPVSWGLQVELIEIGVAGIGTQGDVLAQPHLARVVEDMVDDALSGVVDDVVGFPIVGTIDVEVVPEEVVLQGCRGTKLADGEDVGLHVIQDGTDALILVLRVVVGFVAVGEAAVVVVLMTVYTVRLFAD